MVGLEERFFNRWLSDTFRMSHTWILDQGHHFFLCVWIFVFIVDGARTTSILEDRRGVGFFGRICLQPKFSGGISSSRPPSSPRSIALAAYLVPRPPDELASSALVALVA